MRRSTYHRRAAPPVFDRSLRRPLLKKLPVSKKLVIALLLAAGWVF
jgi:hypothetical protein